MKYPRTPHLPWSKGVADDDEKLPSLENFQGKNLVYTEKLDGECTSLSCFRFHARSEDSRVEPWQTWMKRKWAEICYTIPFELEVFGENLYAIHSIEYDQLPAYFHVFAVVNLVDEKFLSWQETCAFAAQLGFPTTPTIEYGALMEMPIPARSAYGLTCEGYVVRNVESFPVKDFQQNVAKCVRKGHVQTDEHWTKNWRKARLVGESQC